MHSLVDDLLANIHAECAKDDSGEVSDYIPPLAEVDPEPFGICLATHDGHLYEVGDTRTAFSIQSISKPFTYGLALKDRGMEAVQAKIDVEPSGEAYNEISLEPETSRPRNPMINAGAITAASLVEGGSREERFARVRRFYSALAGRELDPDDEVYEAELRAGDRNTAIGYMLKSFGILEDAPEEALDLYTRQCSIQVDCRDLAMMGATMANGGRNPVTGDDVLSRALVQHVLSVMTTSGMYTAAGDWMTTVGLPAKSGVGGGIVAVLPGQLGIAAFSPRLDSHGSSVRGFRAFQRLSADLDLHFLHVTRGARSAVRATYNLSEASSSATRNAQERQTLATHGNRVLVCELHGDLLFPGAESVVRTLDDRRGEFDLLALEIGGIDEIGDAARELLVGLGEQLQADGKQAVLIDPDDRLPDPDPDTDEEIPVFRTKDDALRWCEDWILARHG